MRQYSVEVLIGCQMVKPFRGLETIRLKCLQERVVWTCSLRLQPIRGQDNEWLSDLACLTNSYFISTTLLQFRCHHKHLKKILYSIALSVLQSP